MESKEIKSGRPTNGKKTPFTRIFRELVGNATQQEIADKVGTSRQNVGKWLSGITSPDISALSKISTAYNVSTDYLLGLTQAKTTNVGLKSICDYTRLSEKAVETICEISLSPDRIYSNALNLLLCSSKFPLLIFVIRQWLNYLDLLGGVIDDFKQKIREYGEEPPQDIMKYAAEISLSSQSGIQSCVYREACDIIKAQDDLNYCEYNLQNQLKSLLDGFKKDGENNAQHNQKQE